MLYGVPVYCYLFMIPICFASSLALILIWLLFVYNYHVLLTKYLGYNFNVGVNHPINHSVSILSGQCNAMQKLNKIKYIQAE